MKANFHLSLPCKDIEQTRVFYAEVLKTKVGRSTNSWIDIDLFGNQITFTKSGEFNFEFKNYRLGEQILPSFHFGIIINSNDFDFLYTKLFELNIVTTVKTTFLKNNVGEHQSFFIKDPNDYMIEFKSFINKEDTFKNI